MLREIVAVKQHKGEFRRRWFQDELMDLYVWYDEQHEIVGFQLCYDKSGDEHALTCLKETGYSHHRIETGEESVWEMKAPVLKLDGKFPQQRVAGIFGERSKHIDAIVAEYVAQKIKEYAQSG